ncbi:hypothetical protein SLEP1_g36174 [Rubroshorea leprosula]|uniref:WRKY domain-containing protein n=1 Tax=Rubroshorea leprosula TaxID=152421 RepID=A0AAV5KQP0_9ROSI|nr:hypothetical protein SLEP1_g36174 [Rubroshorea leprosula]
MDYSSWVDTSLDLNSNPRRLQPVHGNSTSSQTQKMEVHSSLIEFERKSTSPAKQETAELVEELNRVSEENKKLTEMLRTMCENYNALRSQLMDYMNKNPEKELSPSKKRKSESSNNNDQNHGIMGNSESSSTDEESCKKPRSEEVVKAKISRIAVRTEPSDTSLIVKDGYQWRKYGQKVTRDNPCPRAYFKCSFAPSCPVKKKVQRSVEDQCVVVATYEGEHNHIPPSQMEANSSSSRGGISTLGAASLSPAGPTITLDLTKPNHGDDETKKPRMDSPEVKQYLVEQMASSLTRDPNFTAALAAAISGRIFPTKFK